MGHLGRTHDAGFDFGLRLGILDGDFGAFRDAMRNNQHRAAGTDGMRRTLDLIGLAFHLNHDANPEQHPLSAAAFFGRGRTRGDNPGG